VIRLQVLDGTHTRLQEGLMQVPLRLRKYNRRPVTILQIRRAKTMLAQLRSPNNLRSQNPEPLTTAQTLRC
jgi:hypothetical protein